MSVGTDDDIVIISYDLAAKFHDKLEDVGYQVVICDESHYLKSPEAKRTKAVLPLVLDTHDDDNDNDIMVDRQWMLNMRYSCQVHQR